MQSLTFRRVNPTDLPVIFSWLDRPHVREFWDNSPQHRQDIAIFAHGRQELTPYYGGIFTYWLGKSDEEPFSLIMTSEIYPTDNIPSSWQAQLSKTGKTMSIDFMIGSEKLIGKGLAAPTLEAFCQFLRANVEPTVDTIIIDPAIDNPRAHHVYEKAGFITISRFTRRSQEFYLMVKRLARTAQGR